MWPLTRNKHQRWADDLSAYLDDQLSPSARDALEAHLTSCASCHEDLESLRNLTSLLHRVPQMPVPRSYTLSEAPAKRLAWSVRYAAPLRYSTAVASLLLLAVVMGDLFTGLESVPSRAPLSSPVLPGETEALFDASVESAPSEAGPAAAFAPTPAPAPESEGIAAPPAVAPTPGTETQSLLTSDSPEEAGSPEEARAPGGTEVEATLPETEPGGAGALETSIDRAKLALAAVIAVLAILAVTMTWLNRRARSSG